ncbi:MAG: thioredoxin family protein [Bacilli bacterium]
MKKDVQSKFNIVIFVAIVIVLLVILTEIFSGSGNLKNVNFVDGKFDNDNKKGELLEVTFDQLKEISGAKGRTIVFFGRPTCSYCVKFKPIITKYAKDKKIDIAYVNTDKITTQTNIAKLYEILGVTAETGFSTPTTAVFENGEILNKKSGYMEADALDEFLSELNNTNSNKPTIEKVEFIDGKLDNGNKKGELLEITFNQLKEISKAKGTTVVFFGRPTCSWCVKFEPVVVKYTEDNKIDITYLNTDKVTSDQMSTIFELLEVDTTKGFGTPTTAIFKDGLLVGKQPGYMEADDLDEFIKSIKE